MRSKVLCALATVIGGWLAGAPAALALPALQLSPGSGGDWTYDSAIETFVAHSSPFDLSATANATNADGGKGSYAWTAAGTSQYAYLIVSTDLKTSSDSFNITIQNDGGALSLYASGSQGILNTYFEIYEFTFDGGISSLGGGGGGTGYTELLQISYSKAAGVGALHFDLFTVEGGGRLGDTSGRVKFAASSNEVQAMPEPGAVAVFAVGNLVAGLLIRRFRKA